MTDKISQTDLYPDLPAEVYHGDCCDGPSISSSGLRTIENECPAKYWLHSPFNPGRLQKEVSSALDFGRAAHHWCLGEADFAKHYVVSPYDDFRKKEAAAWRDQQELTILKAADLEAIGAMASVIQAHPLAARAFEARVECSFIAKHDWGVWLKARPDLWENDEEGGFLYDYKTAASAKPSDFARDVFNFGYHMQAALALDVVEMVTGERPQAFCIIVQEKKPPYLVELYTMTANALHWGKAQYRRALYTFTQCLETSIWPGYTNGKVTELDLPYWADTQLSMREEFGEFSVHKHMEIANNAAE